MMKRCKSCLFYADVADMICPVCGIHQDKPKKELTNAEKRIRYAARGIRSASLLHIIGGVVLLCMLPMWLSPVLKHGLTNEMHPLLFTGIIVYTFAMAVALLVLAVGLRKYAKWAYYMAAVTYGIIFVMNLLNPNIGLLIVVLCAYYIGNKNARAIFNRAMKSSNQALHATSEPAPDAASSSHES